jgi:hypothetical protein
MCEGTEEVYEETFFEMEFKAQKAQSGLAVRAALPTGL